MSCGDGKHPKSHMIIMALACIVPIAIIIILPIIGIQSKWVNFGAITLMIAGHVWMLKGDPDKSNNRKNKKEAQNGRLH